jgi:Tol biopolymer transport system component
MTMDPTGADVVTLVEGSDRIILQPTWSPRGERLAWVEVVLAGGPEDVAVVTALPDGSDRTRIAVSNPPFYLSWDPTGDQLVLLRNGAVQLEAGLIDVTAADPEEQIIGRGQPFYFAWQPGGEKIIAHVGIGDRLGHITMAGEETSLGVDPGLFQAPGWVGDAMFWVRDDDGTQSLVVSDSEGRDPRMLASADGFMHLTVSPDGSRVAYRELDVAAPAVTVGLRAQATVGELVVVDVASGEPTTIAADNPLAFMWSPDSEKLLFLSVTPAGFTWRVWDGESVTTYETFTPSRTLGRDYLPFFDQFALSIELWAPDSESFVYAGRSRSNEASQIWVQPLDGPARPIIAGVFAAFVPSS